MSIDKRDLLTVAVLSVVFFSVAFWNIGLSSVPLSTWRPSRGKSFYVDFSMLENVSAVYFLLKNGRVDFEVYAGFPGNWSKKTEVSLQDYYCWKKVDVNCETRFLKFVCGFSYGEIVELAALNGEGEKITISMVKSEDGEDEKLWNLIDEQEKVECPPTYMSETYFDEIYYVKTAEDYINGRAPSEWTHPPLGKLILTVAILVFGYNPLGWRIMVVVFATLMVPVIYFFGKNLLKTWIGAFASAFLLMFDFMHFTMGRIATVDTFVVFFSLMSHFFFFIYFQNVLSHGWKTSTTPLFLAVVFFALGFSTKWIVLYGFVGQIFLLLLIRVKSLTGKEQWTKRFKAFFGHPFSVFMGFLAFAAMIYFLTFVPNMLIGYSLKDIYDLQFSMYSFHSTLTATHPFSSEWWSWPFIARPVWLYVSDLPVGMVSTIVAMGNLAVWWLGFASIFSAIVEFVNEKNYVCGFIIVIFFFQWLPYAILSRCLFLYHFYSNVPFLIFATVYFVNKSWGMRRDKIFWSSYFAFVVVLFVLFYPVISGTPIPYWWRDSLKWFRGWLF